MWFLPTLYRDESGQDLVEYTLLVMFFGVALLAAWDAIATALGLTLAGANAGLQGLWDAPPPGGSGP